MTLGEQIREARDRLGWTQSVLAERVGVTPSYITKVEQNAALPSYELLLRLANVLVLDGERLLAQMERDRQERTGQRIRTRGATMRGVYGVGADREEPSGEPRVPSTAEQLGREVLGDPDLQAAFTHLRAVLADPELKPVVLKVLETFALQARPGRPEDKGGGRGKKGG
jgi:transcriptional regulator with XRE-family HTH domain